jgi:metacaspase-1
MNRALLVGINAYPTAPLNGCINDINDMAQFLVTNCGFLKSEIRLLADDRATKQGILERLGWLLAGVQPLDRILLFFSGHGVQLPTRNPLGELDGLDEVICPYDFDWSEATALRDKEFAGIFSSIPPGVLFTWVADCCHSDDLTKGFPKLNSKLCHKSIIPPADIAWRIAAAKEKGIGLSKLNARPQNVLLLSGCEAGQESADDFIDNKYNGALTHHLLKYLSQDGFGKPMKEVVKALNFKLKPTYPQNPVLSGSNYLAERAFLN